MTDSQQTNRRTLLRAAGVATAVGLAGCTGSPGDGTDETATDTGTPTDTSTPTGTETPTAADATGRVTLASSDENPSIPVEPGVTVVDESITADGPAVLRVDVDNPTDDAVTIGEYREVVFQYVASTDRTYQLLPHSERSTSGVPEREQPTYPTDDEEACWRLSEPIATTAEYGTVSIPAGGTLTAFVGLYAGDDAGSCLPTGDHRFAATYAMSPLEQDSETATDDGSSRAEWGFSLAVESL